MTILRFAIVMALTAAILAPAHADDHGVRYRNNGYSLLYKLCQQEKPIDLILMVKTTPPSIAAFLHQASSMAKDDLALLDALQGRDRAIQLDEGGLPAFEEDTRASIKEDKAHMLLFGTKDAAFARGILVTQVEAGTYGMNLAKVLAGAEPDADRAAVVRKIGARWEKHRDRAYALLNAM